MALPFTYGVQALQPGDLNDIVETIYQELHLFIGLSGQNPVDSTHQIRKKLKFFRSFLKLLQPCSGDRKAYREANRTLRDLGSEFSDLRDAHVRNLMLEEMNQDPFFCGLLVLINKLYQLNENDVHSIENKLLKRELAFMKLDQSIQADKTIPAYMSTVTVDNECLLTGVAVTYEKAFKAYHSGNLHPSEDMLHEWRKRVKDQQYQFELMLNLLPSGYIAIHNDIIRLSDLLGKEQDLFNFLNWIHEMPGLTAEEDLSALESLLKSRRNKLKSPIENLGKTLYLEDPVQFKQTLFKQSGL